MSAFDQYVLGADINYYLENQWLFYNRIVWVLVLPQDKLIWQSQILSYNSNLIIWYFTVPNGR